MCVCARVCVCVCVWVGGDCGVGVAILGIEGLAVVACPRGVLIVNFHLRALLL